MSILYCKNAPVYDIDTQEVYNNKLLSGLMIKNPCAETFKKWFKLRYSSNTNTIARKLKGVTFGQGNRVRIDKTTHALSLSDCYWIKDKEDKTKFEQISPYYNDFWKGEGLYIGGSVPTLYVGGYLTKAWLNSDTLYKQEAFIEVECSRLCHLADIPCTEVEYSKDNKGIYVKNITNPDIFLEQADMSGRIDPDDFDNNTIIELFGLDGFKMLLVDAIFGNGDRHAGNFGYLRNTDTGEYIGMSALYDFDHALDSENERDILISDILDNINRNTERFKEISLNIIKVILNNSNNEIFKKRAKYLLTRIENL